MVKKTNILKTLLVAFALGASLCSYAESNQLSQGDQARIRSLVSLFYGGVSNNSHEVMVRALAKMDASAVPALEKMGVQVSHLQGNIYSIYFNMANIAEIQKVKGVKQVDITREMQPVEREIKKVENPRLVVRPV